MSQSIAPICCSILEPIEELQLMQRAGSGIKLGLVYGMYNQNVNLLCFSTFNSSNSKENSQKRRSKLHTEIANPTCTDNQYSNLWDY